MRYPAEDKVKQIKLIPRLIAMRVRKLSPEEKAKRDKIVSEMKIQAKRNMEIEEWL